MATALYCGQGRQGAKEGAAAGLIAGLLSPLACFTAGTEVVIGVKTFAEDGGIRTLTARELDEIAEQQKTDVGAVLTRLAIAGYVTQAIETLKKGDYVLCRDQHDPNGPLVLRRIEETFIRPDMEPTDSRKVENKLLFRGRGAIDSYALPPVRSAPGL